MYQELKITFQDSLLLFSHLYFNIQVGIPSVIFDSSINKIILKYCNNDLSIYSVLHIRYFQPLQD